MIKILISLIAILFLFYHAKFFEYFDCMPENGNDKYIKNKSSKNNCVKQETIDSVSEYPNESIDPLFDASFNPLCCPSTYTSSRGCLCYEAKNFNLLATRGGNALSNPL